MREYRILGKKGKLQIPKEILKVIKAKKGDVMKITLVDSGVLVEKLDSSYPCQSTDNSCDFCQCKDCVCCDCAYEDCDGTFCIFQDEIDDLPVYENEENPCENGIELTIYKLFKNDSEIER